MTPPIPDFHTERLRVRPWSARLTDPALPAALSPLLTPEVLADLPPSLQLTDKGIGAWIRSRASESDVYLVEHGDLVGLLLLADTGDALHLGYLFGQAHWGKGYASELVAGLVDTNHTHGRHRLIGGVSARNLASARVLEKAGFRIDPDHSTPETQFFTLP